ncbi:hypothetical protein PoB_005439900 [Plakobranchus ocellatus]|uniref:Uncharacterized protein n=1 Tax=Plakobranchus ocellatus TaxID=259542 RepID=A0AAV4CA13_9GAST|nr:hypothetical protein PoB_005439900 [Plakobranchus ocellatus]
MLLKEKENIVKRSSQMERKYIGCRASASLRRCFHTLAELLQACAFNDYVRWVTWSEKHQRRCLYEYRGKYPGAHAHGKSLNPERTGAYIRLQSQVMDKLKEDVRTQKPDKLYKEADVLYGQKKMWVIYDAKHRGKGNGMNMQTVRSGTFADQG